MTPFKVGIDSYCLNSLQWDPLTILEWVAEQGGDGVQFSEVHLPHGREADTPFLIDLAAAARDLDLYLEWGGGQHVPYDTNNWEAKDLAPGNRRAAEQAHTLGTRIIRSCSGGFFRWRDESPSTSQLLSEIVTSLGPQRDVFTDLGVTLAIELHFEFTTFEIVRLFEMLDAEPGGWLGVCLDTFNVLPLLEDPLAATQRILPWVVSTHVKDGCLILDDTGLVSFPTKAGMGLVDLVAIFQLLGTLAKPVNLSVEDHGGRFTTNFRDTSFLARFPDVTATELDRLTATARVGTERVKLGELSVTEREDWPQQCQDRTRAGLHNVKEIVKEMSAKTA